VQQRFHCSCYARNETLVVANYNYFCNEMNTLLGNSSFCQNVTGFQEELNPGNSGIQVFPNPADQFLTVFSDLESGGCMDIFIVNNLGQEVYRQQNVKAQNSYTINTSGLPAGFYFARIRSGKSTVRTKIMIQ